MLLLGPVSTLANPVRVKLIAFKKCQTVAILTSSLGTREITVLFSRFLTLLL